MSEHRDRPDEDGSRFDEGFFRSLIEHTLDVVSVLDEQLIIRYESPSVSTVLGYDPAEMVGRSGLDWVHPDDAARLFATFGPDLEVPNASATFEYRARHKSGGWVTLEGVARNRLHDPSVRGVILNARDVTSRRQMEAAVRDSEQRLRGLIEHSLDGVALVDEDGHNLFHSDALGRIMGYATDELADRSAFDLIHPDDLAAGRATFARILSEPERPVAMSVRARHKDGSWRDLDLVVVNRLGDPAVRGVVVHFRDVTRQRALEQRLALEQRRLNVFFSSAPVGLVILDDQFRYVRINETLARLHGLPVEAHLGRSVADVLPDRAHLIVPTLRRVLETGEPVHHMDWEAQPAGEAGYLRRLRGSLFPLDSEGGRRDVAGILADITEQRQAEDALRRSEERYRRIVETANEGVWLLDADSRTEYVNAQMAAILGYEPAEMIGRSVFDFVTPSRQAEVVGHIERRRQGLSDRNEFPLVHRDGREVWTEMAATPIFDADHRYQGALAMVTDISSRKTLEEQFRQAQKMEAVGRLAGGIAHDFNNLLTAILGYAQLLSEECRDATQLDGLTQIISAVDSAARLTSQLLTFSRRQILQPARLDLSDVVNTLRGMLGRVIGEDIALDTHLRPGLAAVVVDRGQIEQILMNLAVNARDAMPDGGRLTIGTTEQDLTGREILYSGTMEPGRYVALSVSDTGVGMDAGTLSHIFEPFFTTKGSLGTGLGLATVYGIVQQSGGGIGVVTEPGQGTAFTIYLPCTRGEAEPAAEIERPAVRSTGSEVVLLVEDEDGVRAMISKVLRRYGYRVVEARSPDEALRIVHDGAEVDLLLTDVVMPGMSGTALAGLVTAARPDLRVLFMSGYSEPETLDERLRQPGALLRKPFAPAMLVSQVRRVLEAPPR
ncbi:MAG TPA: PAS domain S-box protein [Vicinamibacterales bacterium]|nr:PAS domain S-box protein [Vicinamibacterales bacterium]